MPNLKELLDAGFIAPGDILVWRKQNMNVPFKAILLTNGSIETEDGKVHLSPSAAARHVNSGVSTNGWRVWRCLSKDKTLSELRLLLTAKTVTLGA
jgi:hypothetical protein